MINSKRNGLMIGGGVVFGLTAMAASTLLYGFKPTDQLSNTFSDPAPLILPEKTTRWSPDTVAWLDLLGKNGLILTEDEIDSVKQNKIALWERRSAIISRYNAILQAISRRQSSLQNAFKKASNTYEKEQIVRSAQETIEASFGQLLFPLWVGGEWDFNGFASTPHKGVIACGWYLERLLIATGFQVVKRDGIRLSYLAEDEMIRSYAGRDLPKMQTQEEFFSHVQSQGFGIYLVGLSKGWGHTLFLEYSPDSSMTFCHSGFSLNGVGVSYDDANAWLDCYQPDSMVVVKIDRSFALRWLHGEEIYPLKTTR